MPRALLASLLAGAVAACGAPGATTATTTATPFVPAGATAARGKLVVLLVIDQWPAWAFAAKRPALARGFDRLLREGTWHTGEHPTPATLTGPGHALIGSGEPPYHSGILANEWWDRASARIVKSTGDRDRPRLRVPALGDALAAAGQGGKAVGISLKHRAALLPIGGGTAIWYDARTLSWDSTLELPWLAAHARAHPISSRLGYTWTPLDPVRLAKLSGTDDAQPGEVGEKGFGPTFPHALADTVDPADAIYATPLGNELVFELAAAAIEGEELGRDAVPDLLALSLSAHDYAGHGWGHESWESWDMTLRLDQQLGTFLALLDAKVGAGNWAMLVTSDHGGTPLPERVGGGRFTYEHLGEVANRAASRVLGPGTWIASSKFPNVYLSAAARARPDAEQAAALREVAAALRAEPGLERVESTAAYAGGCERRTGEALAFCMMLDPELSGELFYLPRHGWVMQEEGEPLAAGHGSMHAYDRQVPVILLPFGRAPHAPAATPSTTIAMVRISTILAGWLGVTPPLSLDRAARTAASPARR